MVQVIVLLTWVGAGVAAAGLCPEPCQPRFAWAPLAIFMGPLWLAVALERREAAWSEF